MKEICTHFFNSVDCFIAIFNHETPHNRIFIPITPDPGPMSKVLRRFPDPGPDIRTTRFTGPRVPFPSPCQVQSTSMTRGSHRSPPGGSSSSLETTCYTEAVFILHLPATLGTDPHRRSGRDVPIWGDSEGWGLFGGRSLLDSCWLLN